MIFGATMRMSNPSAYIEIIIFSFTKNAIYAQLMEIYTQPLSVNHYRHFTHTYTRIHIHTLVTFFLPNYITAARFGNFSDTFCELLHIFQHQIVCTTFFQQTPTATDEIPSKTCTKNARTHARRTQTKQKFAIKIRQQQKLREEKSSYFYTKNEILVCVCVCKSKKTCIFAFEFP